MRIVPSLRKGYGVSTGDLGDPKFFLMKYNSESASKILISEPMRVSCQSMT